MVPLLLDINGPGDITVRANIVSSQVKLHAEFGGVVPNLAARLCGEAKPGEILVPQRLLANVEEMVEIESVGELMLKGFHRPVAAYNILRLKS